MICSRYISTKNSSVVIEKFVEKFHFLSNNFILYFYILYLYFIFTLKSYYWKHRFLCCKCYWFISSKNYSVHIKKFVKFHSLSHNLRYFIFSEVGNFGIRRWLHHSPLHNKHTNNLYLDRDGYTLMTAQELLEMVLKFFGPNKISPGLITIFVYPLSNWAKSPILRLVSAAFYLRLWIFLWNLYKSISTVLYFSQLLECNLN